MRARVWFSKLGRCDQSSEAVVCLCTKQQQWLLPSARMLRTALRMINMLPRCGEDGGGGQVEGRTWGRGSMHCANEALGQDKDRRYGAAAAPWLLRPPHPPPPAGPTPSPPCLPCALPLSLQIPLKNWEGMAPIEEGGLVGKCRTWNSFKLENSFKLLNYFFALLKMSNSSCVCKMPLGTKPCEIVIGVS